MAERAALAGRLAFVTGVDPEGIGQAIALELARQGADVACHYPYDSAGADATVAQIQATGGRATALRADFSQGPDPYSIVVDAAANFLGGLDILINNAGVTERAPFLDVTQDQFDRLFAINFRSHFFCAQQSVRHMQRRGRGVIVNLASVHGHAGVPAYSLYASTKGAIAAFTRQLAVELAPHGIRVNAIAPGLVEVPRHRANPNYSRERMARTIPRGRVGESADIACVAAFLVSDGADFLTGQVIYVDGGTTAKLALSPPSGP